MTDQHTEHQEEPDETQGESFTDHPKRDWDAEATEMGWRPESEWHGDAKDFRDSEEFVKRGEEILQFVRRDRDREREKNAKLESDMDGRFRRLENTYIDVMKRQKAQHEVDVAAIATDQRRAVEEGDVDAYDAQVKRRDALGAAPEVPDGAPPPNDAVVRWAADNPWLKNKAMWAVANDAFQESADSGGDVHSQIAAADAEIRRRYPEKFEAPRATVETGGQVKRGKVTKGAAQLPPEARVAFEKLVREGMYGKDDIAKYAKSYWEQE